MATAPERKLTTILSADAVGYSALMGRDEAGTLATLTAYRETIAGRIAGHRGRLVNTAGDSVLAEFSSVVNAVECAAAIQRELAERNAALPEERRMQFRIGINVGDVMVEGDDLFGDGVNIAARLQALADPGGILISGTAFDQVRNKLALGFDYLGPQPVKNIAEEVPAWRVVLDPDAPRSTPTARQEAYAGALPGSAGIGGTRPASAQAANPAHSGNLRKHYRRAALTGVLIVFFFTLNMLTSPDRLWFQWPTLGVVSVFALRTVFASWR